MPRYSVELVCFNCRQEGVKGVTVTGATSPSTLPEDAERIQLLRLRVGISSAQTGSYFDDDGSTDWDSYIIKSSINFGSPLTASSTDSLRPEISAHLLKAFTTPEAYMKFLSHRGESAQDLLDLLQKLLDHATLKSHNFVCCSMLRSLDYAENPNFVLDRSIFKAYYKGKPACLKIVRLYHKSSQAQFKAFSREAVIWAHDPRKSFCLVSPWISRGNVLEFLAEEPNAHRLCLIYGTASGMEHLHKNGVVHGDLKSLNILVAEPEQGLLTDFGFSYVTDDNGLQGPTLFFACSRKHKGI
ncbi:putative serine/threonine-protein kinase/receptor R831 [Termitomyces sp. T112]|nr:putative serine/threonine-protein kinase/receptor R831 [Termitomyces sp. T112]